MPDFTHSLSQHPFEDDVCSSVWQSSGVNVESLNLETLQNLLPTAPVRADRRLILLTAPRAGFGKTHTLGRYAQGMASQQSVLTAGLHAGDRLEPGTVIARSMETQARMPAFPAQAGWSQLREACGQIVTQLLRRLISSGQLHCANREQALAVLADGMPSLFDPNGAAYQLGSWIGKNRSHLHSLLAAEAARCFPLMQAETLSAWLVPILDQAVDGEAQGLNALTHFAAQVEAKTVNSTWLQLLSLWRPVVLILDHLDGYYRQPEAGIQLSAMLVEWAELGYVQVLVSMNQDLWQASFGHHLPSALEDRLTGCQISLRGLQQAEAQQLLAARLRLHGCEERVSRDFIAFVDVERHFLGRSVGAVSARAFLRHCARQWQIFQKAASSGNMHSAPQQEPPPQQQVSTSGVPEMVPEVIRAAAVPQPPVLPTLPDVKVESLIPSEQTQALFDAGTTDSMQCLAESLVQCKDERPTAQPQHTAPRDEAPSEDAFVKLRKMLAKLRETKDPFDSKTPEATAAQDTVADSPFKPATPSTRLIPHRPSGPLPAKAAAQTAVTTLKEHFEQMRQERYARNLSTMDQAQLADLLRLAGCRFPLVRYTEHELPGLTGRYALHWAMQGLEVLFGLADFKDALYWRTLAGFAMGRYSDLQAATERGDEAVQLKMVAFRTAEQQPAWQALLASDTIPEPVQPWCDAVLMDAETVATLDAMAQIVKETEAGTLSAEPSEVMALMARELDFFWRRLTRRLA
jgi:hypothetical protein